MQKTPHIAMAVMVAAFAFGSAPARADDAAMTADVNHLRSEWERITYLVKDHGAQLDQINALGKEADAVVARYPDKAEPLLWDGIITSETAGIASMFHQLGLAKDARKLFERALAIDPKGLNGSVIMSLGVLYYRVPGFPVGFGDDDVARHDLEQALAMDPDGLDANYFYGDFLVEQGDYAKAKTVLTHALAAPVNPDRPVWDTGRRGEVKALLAKVDKHLAS